MDSSPARTGIERGTITALGAMGLGTFLIANDFTALSVALPSIEDDLATSLNRSQWVINAYTLMFGVIIVTGGRLADLFGRRRIFIVGGAIFAFFSLLGGIAPNIWLLIVFRGLMGIGGALMWPAILGITFSVLPENKAGLAGGLVMGVAGLGNAAGPLIGGGLTDALDWRWVFFINLPITLAAMLVTLRTVPESRDEDAERGIDYRGILTLTGGAIAILVALDVGTESGYGEPVVPVLFFVGALLLGAFAVVERTGGPKSLVPPDVLASQQFVAACGSVLLMSAIYFAAVLYLPQFMNANLGYSAVRAGAGLLPLMGAFAIASFVTGWLYEHLGAKAVVSSGAALLAVGMFMLSFLDSGSSYASLVPGMLVLGVGIGLFYSSITTAGVTALDPARAALAGGVVYMFQVAGGAIGLGFNTAIVLAQADIAGGMRTAFRVDAALAVVGLVVVLRYIGGQAPRVRHLHVHHRRAHA